MLWIWSYPLLIIYEVEKSQPETYGKLWCWLNFTSVCHRPELIDKRKLQLRTSPDHRSIFFIDDCYGRVQQTMDSASPVLFVLRAIRKQDEKAMKRKPVGSTPPWFLNKLLPPGFCSICVPRCILDNTQWHGTVTWHKPFPHQGAFGWYFITAIEMWLRWFVTFLDYLLDVYNKVIDTRLDFFAYIRLLW